VARKKILLAKIPPRLVKMNKYNLDAAEKGNIASEQFIIALDTPFAFTGDIA
jgi:hypothetical protein